jgi:ATP-dependent exoDNAse (exonuclease V) alpha subunit
MAIRRITLADIVFGQPLPVPAHLVDWPVADHVGRRLLRERGEKDDLLIYPARLQMSRCASSPGALRLAHTLARLIGMLERQRACEQPGNRKLRRLDDDVTFTSKTLFIIDEAGTPTLHQLLRLLPDGVRVLMAGDHGQLFPIGFGKVFHDIVELPKPRCKPW